MFSAKSLAIATAGAIVGLYIMDHYMSNMPVIGKSATSVKVLSAPVTKTTALSTYTP